MSPTTSTSPCGRDGAAASAARNPSWRRSARTWDWGHGLVSQATHGTGADGKRLGEGQSLAPCRDMCCEAASGHDRGRLPGEAAEREDRTHGVEIDAVVIVEGGDAQGLQQQFAPDPRQVLADALRQPRRHDAGAE